MKHKSKIINAHWILRQYVEFSDNNQLIQVATANSGRERRGYNQGFQVLAMLHFSSQVVCSQVFITSLLFKPYISIIHTWFKKNK